MADLEGTEATEATEAPVRMEAGAEYRMERAGNVEDRVEDGYRDRPLYEFRVRHAEEFLDGTSWRPDREIEPFSDPGTLVEKVNPDLGERSGAYDSNCADCARCFERSWRGHLEEAAGRSVEVQPDGGLGAEGEYSPETEEWAGEPFRDIGADPESLREHLLAAGHGASAIVHTEFLDAEGADGGHAYNVVNDHGSIRVCDAQLATTFDWRAGSIHPLLDRPTAHRTMAWDARGERIW
ncbi:MAG TPA: toxin glutamine deamidase domain-containing protein [Rugosimonospora sp.]|nr:toxin glutamine deamidase domain-containing protein [Rugosimonospora sp.]